MPATGGTCKIDMVEVVEITFKSRNGLPGANVQAVFALSNSKTGDRYGSGSFNTWSEETSRKMNEAIQSMEKDIASLLFEDASTTDSVSPNAHIQHTEVPSL